MSRQSVDENGATSVANIMQGKFFLSSGLLDHAGAKVQAVRGRQEYNEGNKRTLAGLPYTMVESLLQVLPWDNTERDSGGVRFLIKIACLCMMALTASHPFSSIFMTRGQSCHPRRMGPRPWTKPPGAPSSRCATGTCTSALLYNDFMRVRPCAWLYFLMLTFLQCTSFDTQSTMKYDYAKKAEVAAARHRQKYLQALAEARSSFVDKNKQAARRGHVRPRSVIALRPGC